LLLIGIRKGEALMKKLNRVCVLILLFLLGGCISQYPSLDEYRKSGIGHSIEISREIDARYNSYTSRIGWTETTYELDNGNWVYVEPIPPQYIHWEVNPDGIIVGSTVKKTPGRE
jgi:hypothetical protein